MTPDEARFHLVRLLVENCHDALASAERERMLSPATAVMGVTFESLTDPEFIMVAQKALPGMKRFHDEHDAAKGKGEDGLFGGRR
jgi:hypothetical protein